MTNNQAIIAGSMTERELQNNVIDLAKRRGYLVHAERPAWSQKGYRTPIQGDAGFPDLILVRDCAIIAIELKSEKGKVTPSQKEWLSALSKAGVITYIWKPSDWVEEDILRCLSNDHKTTSTVQRMRDLSSDIPA